MNWIGILISLLKIATVLVCILLVFVVLLQRPKNEGLGAAFGGETASNLFGAQTTNVLATVTRWLGGIFLALCFAIAWLGTVDPERRGLVDEYKRNQAAIRAQALKDEETTKAANDAKNKKIEDDKSKTPAPTGDKKPDAAPVTAPSSTAPVAPKTPPAPAPEAPKAPTPSSVPTPANDGPKPAAPAPVTPAPAGDVTKPAEPAKTPAPAPTEAPKPTEATPAEAPKPAAPATPAPAPTTPPATGGSEQPK